LIFDSKYFRTTSMTSSRRPLILASLLIAAFAINLDTTIVNVALPALVRQLSASDSQLQWVVDAYNLVFAAFILAAGSLSDRVGRKGMLLAGLVVFGLASFAGGLAGSSGELIAARAVMGLGAAMVFPSTLSLIANVFTDRGERALAIGLWGATAGMAIALGPIVGGFLLQHFSWSSIFFAMTPVAILGGALVAVYAPTSRDERAAPLDRAGFLLSTGAMALLIYTIIEAPEHGWGSVRTLAGFALTAVLMIGFLARERGAEAPMLDLSMFGNLRFSAASLSVTVSFFTLLGFIFLMTQYFQFIRGYSALSAGVHLLPVALSVGASSVIGTRLAVKLGTKLVVGAGLVMIMAFYLWVSTGMYPTFPYGTIAVQMVLYGTGMGLTSAPATEAIMGAVSLRKAGAGSAVNDATRLLGGTLGVAVIGSVFASSYTSRLSGAGLTGVPAHLLSQANESIGRALGVAQGLAAHGQLAPASALHNAAVSAFDHGVSVGCLVAAAVAGVGAIAALVWLPAQPMAPAAESEEPPARGAALQGALR
jgi:EmrB/QacA subfamily drug resistance transporter